MAIENINNILLIGPVGSRNATITITRKLVATGCFCGTWEELTERSGKRIWTEQYTAVRGFAEQHFKWLDKHIKTWDNDGIIRREKMKTLLIPIHNTEDKYKVLLELSGYEVDFYLDSLEKKCAGFIFMMMI